MQTTAKQVKRGQEMTSVGNRNPQSEKAIKRIIAGHSGESTENDLQLAVRSKKPFELIPLHGARATTACPLVQQPQEIVAKTKSRGKPRRCGNTQTGTREHANGTPGHRN
jgi:hypothetical protein